MKRGVNEMELSRTGTRMIWKKTEEGCRKLRGTKNTGEKIRRSVGYLFYY